MRKLVLVNSLVLVAAVAGCTTKQTPTPPLTGPSEFALRLALQSVPDSIYQDGAAQASIQIEATGPDGRAVRALPLRIETEVGGLLQDYGMLSARTVVTGEDGVARIVYTAPPRPAESVGQVVVVTFVVTPITNDFQGVEPRRVDLRLVPPGVILPPNSPPRAAFTVSPEDPLPLQDVSFDASGSTDPDRQDAEGNALQCGAACTYRWDFGDGTTGSGVFTTHKYKASGNYQVRLTVTDARGASGAVAQPLTVGEATPPTAAFTFSPTNPAASQTIFFNAESSRPAPGRRLVFYSWDFGSGRTATGITTSKAYDTPATYIVTLTVEDDAGATATVAQPVAVGGSSTGPSADLTVSPSTGSTATTFFFDASPSRGPAPIVEYRFTFGDNTPDVVGTSPTTAHRFTLPGNYVVRVTVRDSANRTATDTVSVSVGTP
jgi:PKD repeat protein